ncbi:MAG TPA: hypothetical protein VK862_14820 [Afifellaceae bacterium]|nr:hypothetical protein [Afifellaceae bacterium]
MSALTTTVAMIGYLIPPAVLLWAGALFLRAAWRDCRRGLQKKAVSAAAT